MRPLINYLYTYEVVNASLYMLRHSYQRSVRLFLALCFKKAIYFLPGEMPLALKHSSLVESAKNSKLSFTSYQLFVAVQGTLDLVLILNIPEPFYTGVPL